MDGWREEPTEEAGSVQQKEREAAAEFKRLLLHKQVSKRRNGMGGDITNRADLDFFLLLG